LESRWDGTTMQNIQLARSLLKAALPFADTARRLKRRLVPYRPNMAHNGFTFDDALDMIDALREAGVALDGEVLEVGSGWTPIVPLLFHMAGAAHVTLTDLERLYDETSIPTAATFLRPRLPETARRLGMEATLLEARMANFAPAYICPWQPARHPAGSVDIAISRAVMEHVPAEDVVGLFRDLLRVVRPGGHMCHSVDNTDHWEHDDSRSSLMSFLCYPADSLRWRLASMNIQGYTNRFRHSDYLRAAREAGWIIVSELARVPPKVLSEVRQMRAEGRLAPEFARRELEDLAATATLIVARKPG
jgi:SAM-dependent methyltransferase